MLLGQRRRQATQNNYSAVAVREKIPEQQQDRPRDKAGRLWKKFHNVSRAVMARFGKKFPNLTSSQCAACAVEAEGIMERLEREARERQGARTDLHDNIEEKIPQSDRPREEQARDKAASLFNTNPRYVQDANV